MSPFHNRPEEWDLFQPLVGSRILELGNKKNREFIYKAFFQSLGFEHVSVDINGQDGALAKDLTKPLGLGTFDMVSNIGTTEHVSEDHIAGQVACWRNILEAMHIGSALVSTTPAPGHWKHHGVWYPEPVFFEELARLNGLKAERIYVEDRVTKRSTTGERDLVCARLVRESMEPFAFPKGGMYRNVRR